MNDEKALDSFRIKQLRKIIGIQYQTRMRNEKVYKVTKTRLLTIGITKARLKLWGHVLGLDENILVRNTMKYVFIKPSASAKKFRGRKRSIIVTILNRDIKRLKKQFKAFVQKAIKSQLDLRNVRLKAIERNGWRKSFSVIVPAAY